MYANEGNANGKMLWKTVLKRAVDLINARANSVIMARKTIVGVMGPGDGATDSDSWNAQEIGKLIAEKGWILLTGGTNAGVMDAANCGAKQAGGLTIGIMPTSDPSKISEFVDIPIITDMKSARNNINALSSDVVVACGIGAGTASEIALAIKAGKNVILLNDDGDCKKFFLKIGKGKVQVAENPEEAIEMAGKIIGEK